MALMGCIICGNTKWENHISGDEQCFGVEARRCSWTTVSGNGHMDNRTWPIEDWG